MFSNSWVKNWTGPAAWLMTMAGVLLTLLPLRAEASSNVPPVVVSTVVTVPSTGLPGDESNVALDTCGNIYAVEQTGGVVVEIPAGGGAAKTVLNAGNGYDISPLTMDTSQSNLFVLQADNGNINKIPITNCVPQPASKTTFNIGNLGPISYYWAGSALGTDSVSDVFIGTNVACCTNANELLVEYASAGYSTGATLLGNLANPITSIAVDSSKNVYYVSGGALYELAYTAGAYSANPVSFGSGYSNNVVGVSFDAAGNMYVADGGSNGSSTVYEIPAETSGSTKTLNPSNQFIVATGPAVTLANAVWPDPSGNLYYANNGSSIYELTRDNANLGSPAVAGTGSATLNVVFNAAVTPKTISVTAGNGVFASTTAVTKPCAAGTAYAAGAACTVDISFTAVAPGLASGALVFWDSTGAALATTQLYGIGLGAGLTADPGSLTSVGSGFKTPTSEAVDAAGDLFIADSGSSAVWEIPAGGTTPVAIGSGLSSPTGVAVDGAGNVYIADTGNSRIVEVPVVNGALSTAAQIEIVPGSTSIAGEKLSSPAGVSIDALGNLYIADTGNDRIVFLPQNNNWDVNGAFTLGSGFRGPLATTVTSSGLIYVADSGNGKVYSIPYPGAAAPITVAATGFSSPSALAVDAAGDLFVVDKGNSQVVRIPNISGSLVTASVLGVSSGVAAPYGVALDTAGNLYVSDDVNAAAYWISRTSPTQSFGKWNPNTTSDSLLYQVENSGNQPLTFNTPYYAATGDTAAFTELTSESKACVGGGSVAAGSACLVEATFTPTTFTGYTETLALSSNAKNTSAPQLTFTGIGAATEATATVLKVTSPTGAPAYDQAIALSVAVTASVGTPSGTVVLLVDGLQSTTATLSNGTATFTLASGLSGGSHTLQAEYEGADTEFVVYSHSDSAILTINVTKDATATALSFTTIYTNPASQPASTALTLTATVSSAFAGIPTGNVDFLIGDSGNATVKLQAALTPAGGGVFQATATYIPNPPAAGVVFDIVTVVASYAGDTNFGSSTSVGQSFDVSAATGSVGLTSGALALTSSKSNEGTVTFTATSYGGWQGVIGYQCQASTLPANAICVFSPGQILLSPSTSTTPYPPATTQLKIVVNNPPDSPAQSSMLWWLAGLLGLGLLVKRRRLSRSGGWGAMVLLLAAAASLTALSAMSGCSNGVSFATPTGTSTVTVVASSDPYTSGSTTTTQACGIVPGSNPQTASPTLAPCAQQTFQVSLTVQ